MTEPFALHAVKKNHFCAIQTHKNNIGPFKAHPLFNSMQDILCHKDRHHLILCSDLNRKMQMAFLESFSQHLKEASPHHIQNAEMVCVDLENLEANTLYDEFQNLAKKLEQSAHLQILIIQQPFLFQDHRHEDDVRRRKLLALLHHPRCRFILCIEPHEKKGYQTLDSDFCSLSVKSATQADYLLLLKQQRAHLEHFHNIDIPEDLLSYAYALAERYLNNNDPLDDVLCLLDSAAARLHRVEGSAENKMVKPVLSATILADVLSEWVDIPASHLALNRIKRSEFIQVMQQQLFGQEPAIALLANEIQRAQTRLRLTPAPFCSALFAGPQHAGKKAAAHALATYLLNDAQSFFYVSLCPSIQHSLLDLKLQSYVDHRYITLKTLLEQMPYAVLMFEHIEKAPQKILEELHEILVRGTLQDAAQKPYHFQQTTLLLSTTLGSERLAELIPIVDEEDGQAADLMQLFMIKPDMLPSKEPLSPEEMVAAILPDIRSRLPNFFCKDLCIAPFLPLTKISAEKVLQQRIKSIAKQLNTRFHIELNCAPEVIHFLADRIALKRDNNGINTNQAIKQIYACIEQALLQQVDHKTGPQLFLHLNETGELLQSDWVTPHGLRQHAT